MSKKVLIVTYHWPPSGGISVLRCLKIAKYLHCFGWEPVIYTPANAQYDYLDYSNEKDIPAGITILKQPILEPFNLFKKVSGRSNSDSQNPVYVRDRKRSITDKLAMWIRANFFIPDARCLWIKPSVKFLSKYLKENKIDAIFSDGPPHTNTVIACKLAQKYNIPWLADFQDPWTQVDYYEMFPISKIADWRHRRMEQKVFRIANKITIASPSWANDLESIGAKNVSPIYYGYDEDDFKNMEPKINEFFTIVHAGQLGIDRSPDTLLQVIADIKINNPDFAKKLRISFAGLVDYSIIDKINKLNLNDNFNNLGKISREQALLLTLNSNILLLPLNKAKNVMGRIPGKLFELLRANKTILCLGPVESDAAKIVSECNAGSTFNYTDYDNLKLFIQNKYAEFEDGILNNKPNNIENFSNYYQTKLLSEFLNKITIEAEKNIKK